MGIVGVGTDIIEASRFGAGRISERLLARVFTPGELAYCKAQKQPERHLAARFAAKEAAVKALSGLLPGLMVSQIEVVNEADGKPCVRLVRGLGSPAPPPLPAGLAVHLSLSHARAYAAAIVVAEQIGV